MDKRIPDERGKRSRLSGEPSNDVMTPLDDVVRRAAARAKGWSEVDALRIVGELVEPGDWVMYDPGVPEYWAALVRGRGVRLYVSTLMPLAMVPASGHIILSGLEVVTYSKFDACEFSLQPETFDEVFGKLVGIRPDDLRHLSAGLLWYATVT